MVLFKQVFLIFDILTAEELNTYDSKYTYDLFLSQGSLLLLLICVNPSKTSKSISVRHVLGSVPANCIRSRHLGINGKMEYLLLRQVSL